MAPTISTEVVTEKRAATEVAQRWYVFLLTTNSNSVHEEEYAPMERACFQMLSETSASDFFYDMKNPRDSSLDGWTEIAIEHSKERGDHQGRLHLHTIIRVQVDAGIDPRFDIPSYRAIMNQGTGRELHINLRRNYDMVAGARQYIRKGG